MGNNKTFEELKAEAIEIYGKDIICVDTGTLSEATIENFAGPDVSLQPLVFINPKQPIARYTHSNRETDKQREMDGLRASLKFFENKIERNKQYFRKVELEGIGLRIIEIGLMISATSTQK